MTDDSDVFISPATRAYEAGYRRGLQVGADNARALLARRGELTAEMAGAIERRHAARGVSPSLVATDEAAGWPTPRRSTLTEADGTVKPWDGSSYS